MNDLILLTNNLINPLNEPDSDGINPMLDRVRDIFNNVLDYLQEYLIIIVAVAAVLLFLILLRIYLKNRPKTYITESFENTFFFTNLLFLRTHHQIALKKFLKLMKIKRKLKLRERKSFLDINKFLQNTLTMKKIENIAAFFEIPRVDLIFTDLRLPQYRYLIIDELKAFA